jgi:hypothetical protein
VAFFFVKKLQSVMAITQRFLVSASRSLTIAELTQEDLKDGAYVEQAVKDVLSALLPQYPIPSGWYFRPVILAQGFAINTNFDFTALNKEYHKKIPPTHSSLSSEYLINHLFEARGALFTGAKYLGELVVDPATSSIIKLKCVELMRKQDTQVRELDLFQELYLPNARTIRECLNNGERTFEDFLKLLEHARKFKTWLAGHGPDQRLLEEYYQAATASTWLDKLGTKGTRWAITTGLAAAVEAYYPTGLAMAGASALSLFDATLLDRIRAGWRPNHFVEGRLGRFVRGE